VCAEQRAIYIDTFGAAPTPITPKFVRRAFEVGLNIDWGVCRLLTQAARDEYERASVNAWVAYLRARDDAWRMYIRTCDDAQEVYDRAIGRTRETHLRAIAPAHAAYECVSDAAWDEFQRAREVARDDRERAIATALAEYRCTAVEALIRIVWGETASAV
jgi:hypothetical protein